MTFVMVTAIGNLADDMTLRHTGNGTPVTNGILIADHRLPNDEYETVSIGFRKFGASAEFLSQAGKKGRKLFITGNARQYTDPRGHIRYTVDVETWRWCDSER